MNYYLNKILIEDNGGRRNDRERRQFSYTVHIPERRNSAERRSRGDRRKESRGESNSLSKIE